MFSVRRRRLSGAGLAMRYRKSRRSIFKCRFLIRVPLLPTAPGAARLASESLLQMLVMVSSSWSWVNVSSAPLSNCFECVSAPMSRLMSLSLVWVASGVKWCTSSIRWPIVCRVPFDETNKCRFYISQLFKIYYWMRMPHSNKNNYIPCPAKTTRCFRYRRRWRQLFGH